MESDKQVVSAEQGKPGKQGQTHKSNKASGDENIWRRMYQKYGRLTYRENEGEDWLPIAESYDANIIKSAHPEPFNVEHILFTPEGIELRQSNEQYFTQLNYKNELCITRPDSSFVVVFEQISNVVISEYRFPNNQKLYCVVRFTCTKAPTVRSETRQPTELVNTTYVQRLIAAEKEADDNASKEDTMAVDEEQKQAAEETAQKATESVEELSEKIDEKVDEEACGEVDEEVDEKIDEGDDEDEEMDIVQELPDPSTFLLAQLLQDSNFVAAGKQFQLLCQITDRITAGRNGAELAECGGYPRAGVGWRAVVCEGGVDGGVTWFASREKVGKEKDDFGSEGNGVYPGTQHVPVAGHIDD